MNYPVICLKPGDRFVYFFGDEKSIKTADKKLVQGGIFNNVSIVDALGKCYLVKSVEILGWATKFWGYSFRKAGQLVRIEFELVDDGTISLDQLKEKLYDRVDSLNFTNEEVERGFVRATSIRQIINFFK